MNPSWAAAALALLCVSLAGGFVGAQGDTGSASPTSSPSPGPGSSLPAGSSPSPVASPATEAKPVAVTLKDSSFHPQVAIVLVNQTVTWTNKDAFNHDVTGVDNDLKNPSGSGGMKGGDSFEHGFAAAGVYDYYCTLHSTGRGNGMWGRVIVVEAPLLGVTGGGAAVPDAAEIGVRWLAHWVGIVSILAVMATLLIYYFVLKYGESVHTTDHRDRKEK